MRKKSKQVIEQKRKRIDRLSLARQCARTWTRYWKKCFVVHGKYHQRRIDREAGNVFEWTDTRTIQISGRAWTVLHFIRPEKNQWKDPRKKWSSCNLKNPSDNPTLKNQKTGYPKNRQLVTQVLVGITLTVVCFSTSAKFSRQRHLN